MKLINRKHYLCIEIFVPKHSPVYDIIFILGAHMGNKNPCTTIN